jgi:2-dehydropantoate 2-reductase
LTTKIIKKACIYGAGAIGGWIGAGLAAAGTQVSVVARGATLQAIRQHGLRLKRSGQTGEVVTAHTVNASERPTDLGVQDLLVIAVKAPSLAEVARHVAPLIGPETLVLTAMNGVPWWFFQGFGGALAGTRLTAVDPTGEIAAAFPPASLIGCVVHASCSVPEPGLIQHHFGNGLIVGEPSGKAFTRVQALTDLLVQAGFNATLSPQIQKDIWYKLWGNMTVNPISAMTGATTDLIMGDDLVRNFVSAVMLEAKEIGARIGIPIDQQPADRHAVTMKLGAFKTSMLQDVEAGRAVELDALVTVVKELGGLTGVATPFTDALLGLSRLHARVHGLY